MVGTCDVKFPIRLEGLSLQHVEFCSVRISALGSAAAAPVV